MIHREAHGMRPGLVTVAVSGAFDPIHVGHIRYIREAAKLGDVLIVILNTDDFLLRKKGFVFIPFLERKEILKSIRGVTEVVPCIDQDQTVRKTLELIKPDIFAKGGDRVGPEYYPESATCERIGTKLVTYVGGSKVYNSSELSIKVKEIGMESYSQIRVTCPYCDNHPILKERCLYCKGTGKIVVGKSNS